MGYWFLLKLGVLCMCLVLIGSMKYLCLVLRMSVFYGIVSSLLLNLSRLFDDMIVYVICLVCMLSMMWVSLLMLLLFIVSM